MSTCVCNAYQLLPGEACPEYAYRYRFLGQCLPGSFHDAGAAWRALASKLHSEQGRDEALGRWLGAAGAQWRATHFTGWHPRLGLAFRLESAPAGPARAWNWDFQALRPSKQARTAFGTKRRRDI